MKINIDDQDVFELADNFVSLSSYTGLQISNAVLKLTSELLGKISQLKFVGKLNDADMTRYFSDSESKAINALLVSALWSAIDPYVAGSVHGQHMIGEIKKAMKILSLSLEEIRYFSVADTSEFISSVKIALRSGKK